MEGIVDSVPAFYGKKYGFGDPEEYLETINFVVKEKYDQSEKALVVKRLMFRARLREEALRWYQRLDSAVRAS